MIEYDYGYKHLQLMAGAQEIIVELSKDTMFKETSYSAKSNLLFWDTNEEAWGHAAGVGRNEQDALKMCIGEIENYTNHNVDMNLMTEIDIPKRFTFIYKKRTGILYIKQKDNNFSILTSKGRIEVITDDIVEYISKKPKEFVNCSVDDYSEQLFKTYNFSKPFDEMYEKYNNSETSSLNNC